MKVSIIAALHGDEIFGLKIAGKIMQRNLSGYDIVIAHPEAIAKNVRGIDADLNRSFHVNADTVESALAIAIEQQIRKLDSDIIIDLHSSISDVPKVAIIATYNEQLVQLAEVLGMESVVLLPKHVTEHSMIGQFPDRSIALEFGREYRSDELAQGVADKLATLEHVKLTISPTLPVYEVFTTIPKDFAGLHDIQNLQYNEALGGYPFLAGTDTYETIGGFLARKRQS